jgi:hypothetical protein
LVNTFVLLFRCRFRKQEKEVGVGIVHVNGVDRKKYIRRSTIWDGYVSEEIGGNSECALGIDKQRDAKMVVSIGHASWVYRHTSGYYPQEWKELWSS